MFKVRNPGCEYINFFDFSRGNFWCIPCLDTYSNCTLQPNFCVVWWPFVGSTIHKDSLQNCHSQTQSKTTETCKLNNISTTSRTPLRTPQSPYKIKFRRIDMPIGAALNTSIVIVEILLYLYQFQNAESNWLNPSIKGLLTFISYHRPEFY